MIVYNYNIDPFSCNEIYWTKINHLLSVAEYFYTYGANKFLLVAEMSNIFIHRQ